MSLFHIIKVLKEMKILSPVLFIFLFSACTLARSVNLQNASKYFDSGVQYEKSGKWFDARKAYGRAWTNATLGHSTSDFAYDYGRASGAICDWEEAERALMESYKMQNGNIIPNLAQLAWMYHAKGDLNKSEEFFLLGIEALEKDDMFKTDPIGFANFLADYGKVLSSLGKTKELEQINNKEKEIRDKYKYRTSALGDFTPYGKFCYQNPQIKSTQSKSG